MTTWRRTRSLCIGHLSYIIIRLPNQCLLHPMSTASLPSYAVPYQPSFSRIPSYSAEPGIYEQRLALNARSLPQATGNFIKSSKSGNAKLRLTAQENNIDLPIYGTGGVVEGTVELTKTDNISTVEITVMPLASKERGLDCSRWKAVLN